MHWKTILHIIWISYIVKQIIRCIDEYQDGDSSVE